MTYVLPRLETKSDLEIPLTSGNSDNSFTTRSPSVPFTLMFRMFFVVNPRSNARKLLYWLYPIIAAVMKINEKVYWTTINTLRIVTFRNTFNDDASFKTCIALIREKNNAGKKPARTPTTIAIAMKLRTTPDESESETRSSIKSASERNCVRKNKNRKNDIASASREMITDSVMNCAST